ncbi:MAG: hypothetical protein ABIY48_02625, partial [Acidimicrobiales bacterium]
MRDVPGNAPEVPADGAVAGALALLRDAEQVAGHTRAAADNYAHQREREADLLIQKARRLLLAAEAKAAVIVAGARTHGQAGADKVIDLDALSRAAGSAAAAHGGSYDSELDRLL